MHEHYILCPVQTLSGTQVMALMDSLPLSAICVLLPANTCVASMVDLH